MNPMTLALLAAASLAGPPTAPYPDEHELPPPGSPSPGSRRHDPERLARAEAKRARKAARRLGVDRG